MSATRWAAAAVVVVTLAMNAGTLWVLFGTEFLSRFAQPGLTESYVVFVYAAVAGFGAVSTSYVLVGLLLSGRRGAGRIAAVLLAGGTLLAATPFGYSVGGELAYEAPPNALANAVFLIGPVAFGSAFSLILPGLALVFPNGRLPSRRWRLPRALVAAALGVGTAVELTRPGPIAGAAGSRNPFGIDGVPAALLDATPALLSGAVVGFTILGGPDSLSARGRDLAAAAPVVCCRGPARRRAAATCRHPRPGWAVLGSARLRGAPPRAGLVRHRGDPPPVVRNRPADQPRPVVGGPERSTGCRVCRGGPRAPEPARRRDPGRDRGGRGLHAPCRGAVPAAPAADPNTGRHRFNRARYNAERTAIAFAQRLRDEVDLTALRGDITGVVETALRPRTIGVWLRKPVPNTSRRATP